MSISPHVHQLADEPALAPSPASPARAGATPRCTCFSTCTKAAAALFVRDYLPRVVTSSASPWFGYLAAIYPSLALPFDMEGLRWFYHNDGVLWPREVEWPMSTCHMKHGTVDANASGPPCSSAVCDRWRRHHHHHHHGRAANHSESLRTHGRAANHSESLRTHGRAANHSESLAHPRPRCESLGVAAHPRPRCESLGVAAHPRPCCESLGVAAHPRPRCESLGVAAHPRPRCESLGVAAHPRPRCESLGVAAHPRPRCESLGVAAHPRPCALRYAHWAQPRLAPRCRHSGGAPRVTLHRRCRHRGHDDHHLLLHDRHPTGDSDGMAARRREMAHSDARRRPH